MQAQRPRIVTGVLERRQEATLRSRSRCQGQKRARIPQSPGLTGSPPHPPRPRHRAAAAPATPGPHPRTRFSAQRDRPRRAGSGRAGAAPGTADTALRVYVPSIRLEESRGRAASAAASHGRNRLDSRTGARSPVSTSTTRPARAAHRRSLARTSRAGPRASARHRYKTCGFTRRFSTVPAVDDTVLSGAPARRPGSRFGAQQESQCDILSLLSDRKSVV